MIWLFVLFLPAILMFIYLLFKIITNNESKLIDEFDNKLLGKISGVKNPGEGIPRLTFKEVRNLSYEDKRLWIIVIFLIFILFAILSYFKFYKELSIPGWL